MLLGGTVVLFGLVVLRLVVMARELEQSRTLLLHEATHDGLTGLGNRTLFSDQVERALANGVPVAVLCLDLDDFKMVNDSLGHPAGDVVLQVVGERLLGLLRPGDAVARLGGDEFAMMVTGPDAATGAAVAQRALAAICQAIGIPDGPTVHSNVSIGIAHSSTRQLGRSVAARRRHRHVPRQAIGQGPSRGVPNRHAPGDDRSPGAARRSGRGAGRATSSSCTINRSSRSIPVGRSVSKRCCVGSIRAAAASSRCSSSRLPKRPN